MIVIARNSIRNNGELVVDTVKKQLIYLVITYLRKGVYHDRINHEFENIRSLFSFFDEIEMFH